ncbi:unnamed protein product [Coregonus sp. 'balchen']|nr:unnamed protein product [Coregonus sp. 'balchen']
MPCPSGETGSGKPTQIPQYLYEAGIARQGIIAVTQPRRVAAVSLAKRVAEEKRTQLGKLVGYTVRFEDVTSSETKLKFMTDGMLLREAIGDPLLLRYTVVVLDEAHVVKAAQRKRREQNKIPLKVIVMSATMDVDLFSQYFNKSPVLYLEVRQHPIQIYYTKQPQSDYLQAALTSITISGIKYVIDTGMVKAKRFNPESGLEVLAVQRVSKAQGWQRAGRAGRGRAGGRAGREDSGSVYRLYTEDEFDNLIPMTVPEIQRCNLASIMLQLLALGIPDVMNFDFTSKPSPGKQCVLQQSQACCVFSVMFKSSEAMRSAVEQLDLLGAVWKKGEQTILLSPDFQCSEEVLTIVSLLSVDTVLYNPPARRGECLASRNKFTTSEGDHLTLLNIYRAFKKVNANKEWCRENFVNSRNMSMVGEVRAQLREICLKLSMKLESCGSDTGRVRRCLAHGLFVNAAELQPDGSYTALDTHQPVAILPSSVLFQAKPAYVVFNELLHTSKDMCLVDADWLVEAAPEYFRRKLRPTKS